MIVTSGTDEKLERAKQLGADHGINHCKQNFVAEVDTLTDKRGVDVVLDCVAGEIWRKSLAVLARGGCLVTCGATAGGQPIDDLSAIYSKHLKIYGSTLGSREGFVRYSVFCRFQEYDRLSTDNSLWRMPPPHSSGWKRLGSLAKSFCRYQIELSQPK